MVSFSKICFAAVAAGGAFAAPAPPRGPLAKFGELKELPSNWIATGPASTEAMITAQIGLKQKDIQGLQKKLMDISDPNSPNYGKWLSKEEVEAYTAPADSDVAAVKSWLSDAGISDVTQPTNDWLQFTVPVSKLESLLGSKYEWYTHLQTGVTVPRTTEFSVPENLHSLIDVVTPTTAFYHNLSPQAQGQAAAAQLSTPAFIRSAYNVDYNSTGSQTVASSGLIGVGASHEDYAQFGNKYANGLDDFEDVSVNGGHNSGDGSKLEGNLDTQYVGALSYPNKNEYLASAPEGADFPSFNDAILGIATYLNSNSNPPSAVSTSYGGEERTIDHSYLDRICNEFMKAGSRGVSVFFSSGDHGVAGNGEPSCGSGYYSTWPASCPYITAVGGTEFDSSNREVVADFGRYTNGQLTSSGGGYSEYFTAPSYNKAITSAYAKSLPASQQRLFDSSHRGYPDISLVSVNFPIIVGGKAESVVGTSASSPSVAGLFGVLNDYRQTQGKPALGFINPLLYSGKVDAALRDVTSGSNYGCNNDGYPAKKGWDAATGLGSFDFGKLRSLI